MDALGHVAHGGSARQHERVGPVGLAAPNLGIYPHNAQQLEQRPPEKFQILPGSGRNRKQTETLPPEFGQNLKVVFRSRQVAVTAHQQGRLGEETPRGLTPALTDADLRLLQLSQQLGQLLEHARITEVEHQRDGVGVSDGLRHPGLGEIRMQGRQVHQLDLDVFKRHHSRQGQPGGERIVGDLGRGMGEGGQQGRLAAVGRAHQRHLTRALMLDVIDRERVLGRAFLLPRAAQFLQPALQLRLHLFRPLVLGDGGQHLFQRDNFLGAAARLFEALLGFQVFGSEIGRHN